MCSPATAFGDVGSGGGGEGEAAAAGERGGEPAPLEDSADRSDVGAAGGATADVKVDMRGLGLGREATFEDEEERVAVIG